MLACGGLDLPSRAATHPHGILLRRQARRVDRAGGLPLAASRYRRLHLHRPPRLDLLARRHVRAGQQVREDRRVDAVVAQDAGLTQLPRDHVAHRLVRHRRQGRAADHPDAPLLVLAEHPALPLVRLGPERLHAPHLRLEVREPLLDVLQLRHRPFLGVYLFWDLALDGPLRPAYGPGGRESERERPVILGRGTEELRRWHRRYAWHPVDLEDGRVAWLEWVERRHDSRARGSPCRYRVPPPPQAAHEDGRASRSDA